MKIGVLSAVPKSEKNLQIPLFFHFHICTEGKVIALRHKRIFLVLEWKAGADIKI